MNNISFPKLGISFNISPVAFTIGSKCIYWYAIIILSGFLAGAGLCAFRSKRFGLERETIWDIAIFGIFVGIIGARIYYVLFALDEFKDNFFDVFKIWEGGLAIYGGIIGAIISTTVYSRIKKINILNAFDAGCTGLLLGQAIGRWGNFVNCEVYGKVTDSVFGMSIDGMPPVQPMFLYESVWNLIGVILLILFSYKRTKNGQVMCLYLLWYSAGRIVMEGMRDSSYILYMIPGKLGISQFVAALFIVISAAGLIYITKSDKSCFKIKDPKQNLTTDVTKGDKQ